MLDLELAPGFYGLWFGSGRFGATGDGTLYSQNQALGSWYTRSIAQPSGNTGFFNSRLSMFVDASSEPSTVQLRPTVDAAATKSGATYVIADDNLGIEAQYRPSTGTDKRPIVEFDLRGVPQGAIVQSVKLEFDVNGFSQSGPQRAHLLVHGYAGDGQATPDDAQSPLNLIGTSPDITDTDLYSMDLSAAYVQSLLGVSPYLGLMGMGDANGLNLSFKGSEHGSGEAPFLTISYTLPSDFNHDGYADGVDLATWQTAFGSAAAGDATGDGTSDGGDFLLWQRQSNRAASAEPAAAAVPEPLGLGLLIAGLMAASHVSYPNSVRNGRRVSITGSRCSA